MAEIKMENLSGFINAIYDPVLSVIPIPQIPVYSTELFELVNCMLIVSVNVIKKENSRWFEYRDFLGKQHATFYIRSHKTGRPVKLIYPVPGALPTDWTTDCPDYAFPLFFQVAAIPENADLMEQKLIVVITK